MYVLDSNSITHSCAQISLSFRLDGKKELKKIWIKFLNFKKVLRGNLQLKKYKDHT